MNRTSGLPAEIKSVISSGEETIIRLTSFDKYGGLPSESNITTSGDVFALRTVESVRKVPGAQLWELFVMTVTLVGEGSSFSYEIPGGAKPIRRPNKVTITHKNSAV